MPSLWLESFGLVAAEAMLNGIPVLASNRGGLPETIGTTALTLALFRKRETGGFPSTSLSLHAGNPRRADGGGGRAVGRDDHPPLGRRGLLRPCSRAARERAQAWHPDRLAPLYRDFFSRIIQLDGALREMPATTV